MTKGSGLHCSFKGSPGYQYQPLLERNLKLQSIKKEKTVTTKERERKLTSHQVHRPSKNVNQDKIMQLYTNNMLSKKAIEQNQIHKLLRKKQELPTSGIDVVQTTTHTEYSDPVTQKKKYIE